MLDEGVKLKNNDNNTLSINKTSHEYLIKSLEKGSSLENAKTEGKYWEENNDVYIFQDSYHQSF